MVKKKFKIFATDGKEICEVFFITQDSKGDFYFGVHHPGFDGKFSRHVSGKSHLKAKTNGQPLFIESAFRQKLSEFKGREQLVGIGVNTDNFDRFQNKKFSGNKFDGSAIIDIRLYKNYFNISPFLIEPNKLNLLDGLPDSFYNKSQIIIFTQSNPWIVLFINEPIENE